uniref:F-box domain-containing protein n=1 Tax=Moniliophthora roreri TaxID=221103 RepID=A0A0W0FDK5_MONRR
MSQSTPLELVYQIIDIVAKERSLPALNTCSLVSRAWCHYTRPYVFQHITISNPNSSCKHWTRRLKSAPHLIPLITSVALVDKGKHSEHPSWSVDAARESAQTLTHVRSLSIRDFDDASGDFVGHHCAFISNLRSLQSLSLHRVELETAEQLFPFLSIIPSTISSLSLRNIGSHIPYDEYWEVQPISDAGAIPLCLPSSGYPWRLRNLTLSSTEVRQDVFSWLLSPAFDLSCLHSLALVAGFQDDTRLHVDQSISALMDQFMTTVAPTLRNLTLAIRGEGTSDNLHIDYIKFTSVLSELTSLGKLILVSEHRRGLNPWHALSLCNQLLPRLHQPTLKELVLVIDLDLRSTADIQSFGTLPEWASLDINLESSTFRDVLIVVEVSNNVSANNYNEEVEVWVRRALPRVHSRRILQVQAKEARIILRQRLAAS